MKRYNLLFIQILFSLICKAQIVNDSIYNSWWKNKEGSIFENIHKGTFSGSANGYIHLINKNDTIVLDFNSTIANLKVIAVGDSVYDDNTKRYVTKTTSGKTTLQYETFMLANILTIVLDGIHYSIGGFDGAADMPVLGLTFNYCHDKNVEYLTLFLTKPIILTTTAYLFHYKNLTYKEANINEKTLTILPGSTLIFTINKTGNNGK